MLNNLPLVDLHRHLDGNVRPSTILELGQKFNVELPASNLVDLIPFVQAMENETSLMAFLPKLDWGVSVLGDLDACKRLAYENVEDLVLDNIDYAELRFSPYYMARFHNLPLEGVVEAVIDGVKLGQRDFNVQVNLIGIMSRTFGVDACKRELDAILAHKQDFVAVDIAGDEVGYPGTLFVNHFNQVRNAGLRVIAHAGEALGAESIWQAIQALGAQRIGHGVNAIHDPRLMEYLRDNRIGIESCLTSNIQTSTVDSLVNHPIKRFLESDILACINSDDPAVHGINLTYEYTVVAPQVGLTSVQIEKMQLNAVEMAFLSTSEKEQLLAKGSKS